ncbi:MAG: hypothetical protein H6650_13750 [Ardenticatenales bacterium]|nr:hypothetical protein [Ardenticatenales bacterium]
MSHSILTQWVHDKTVAGDYYAAMAVIEEQMELHLVAAESLMAGANGCALKNGNPANLLTLAAALQTEPLTASQQAVVNELQCGLLALANSVDGTPKPKEWVVNEQVGLLPPVGGGPSS